MRRRTPARLNAGLVRCARSSGWLGPKARESRLDGRRRLLAQWSKRRAYGHPRRHVGAGSSSRVDRLADAPTRRFQDQRRGVPAHIFACKSPLSPKHCKDHSGRPDLFALRVERARWRVVVPSRCRVDAQMGRLERSATGLERRERPTRVKQDRSMDRGAPQHASNGAVYLLDPNGTVIGWPSGGSGPTSHLTCPHSTRPRIGPPVSLRGSAPGCGWRASDESGATSEEWDPTSGDGRDESTPGFERTNSWVCFDSWWPKRRSPGGQPPARLSPNEVRPAEK